MLTDAKDTVPDAAMSTVAAFCAPDGFVTWNEKMYSVPAVTVWPEYTVRSN